MLYFQAIWRALTWLIIGIVFGLASVGFVLLTSTIFSQTEKIEKLIDPNIIIFLCLALMGGAGADFLLSKISTVYCRLFYFAVIVVFFVLGCVVFNASLKPKQDILEYIEYGYIAVTVSYCMIIKSIIFYQERLAHKKLNFNS